MKKVLLFVIVAFLPLLAFGQMINNFDAAPADTNYWAYFDNHGGQHYQTSDQADSAKGWLQLTFVSDPVQEGTGAMKVDYSVHNSEGWGGYSKLEHWNPDSSATYDWSKYDSIAFWYYNAVPQSLAGRVTFRLDLQDVSDSPNGNATYSVNDCEYYYSFQQILDSQPGWNRFAMPLTADPNAWSGEAFNLTGWSGISGNGKLDLDKIKGFSFEFSISGAGEGDVSAGTIIFDHFTLFSPASVSYIFFNGKEFSSSFTGWAWGQSTHEVEIGAGAMPGTNAIKWTQGNEWNNGWSGIGWSINPPYDLSWVWDTDSLKCKIKAEAGVGPIRFQFEDGAAKKGITFQPIDDNTYHTYAFKLTDFIYEDGTSNFDSTKISVLGIMAEGSAIAGKVLYITDIWTGNPVIDVVAPAAPNGLASFAGQYFNLVTWEDVPGEEGETYTIYASQNPITDLTAPGIDVVKDKVAENTQQVTHYLMYPLKDAPVTYYYAAVCKDDFSNASPAATAGPFTNTAKGIATISLNPPANFVADGDPTEFINAGIMPFNLKASESHWGLGSFDNDNDMNANCYLAIDDDNLYAAFDVIDDVYSYDPTGNFWEDDIIELYLGLYDLKTVHTGFKRGAEPDYKIIFLEKQLDIDAGGSLKLYDSPSEGYIFQPYGASDYVIEAKIPLDSLRRGAAANDARFHPKNGMRIIMDIAIHDSDSPNVRDGILTYDNVSADNHHTGPQYWSYSWIGDTTVVTGVNDKPLADLDSYELMQNYPNPFNPTTTIAFTTPKAGRVTIELYNVLGQRIATLVDGVKPAGQHKLEINAKDMTSGVYFYRIQAGSFSATRKMVLMR
ncbi:T9SS type A sorting domain-containing protein [candidate division KSB1 bacterium]|nr:T9SS type A sorting domain-containing protein [candidate division KSB1 bacterium]